MLRFLRLRYYAVLFLYCCRCRLFIDMPPRQSCNTLLLFDIFFSPALFTLFDTPAAIFTAAVTLMPR